MGADGRLRTQSRLDMSGRICLPGSPATVLRCRRGAPGIEEPSVASHPGPVGRAVGSTATSFSTRRRRRRSASSTSSRSPPGSVPTGARRARSSRGWSTSRRAEGYGVVLDRRQGPGQPGQALARRRPPRRDRGRWSPAAGTTSPSPTTARGRGGREDLRRWPAASRIDGAARRAEPDVPDARSRSGSAAAAARRRASTGASTTSGSTTTCSRPEEVAVLATPESIGDDRRDPRGASEPGAGPQAPRRLPGDHADPRVPARPARQVDALAERNASARSTASRRRWSWRRWPTPRETHVLIRGQYDKPGERRRAGRPGLPAAAAAADRPESPRPRALAGRSGEPADGPGRGQPPLADALRHRAWSRPSRTSAARASGPAIPSCSTGWRPSSSGPAGTSRRCIRTDRHAARPIGSRRESTPEQLAARPGESPAGPRARGCGCRPR